MRSLIEIRTDLRAAWSMVAVAEAARRAGRAVDVARFVTEARALEREYVARTHGGVWL